MTAITKRLKVTVEDVGGGRSQDVIVDLEMYEDLAEVVTDFHDVVTDLLGPIVDRGIDDAGNPINVNFDDWTQVKDIVEIA